MAGPTEIQVVPSPALLLGLTQLLDTGGPFDTMTMFLFQNNIAPSRATVIGDLTIANYSGYANVVAVAFSASFYDADGTALALGADAPFIATTATPFVPNTIYGYGLANAGLTSLRAAYRFATPVNVAQAGDACPVVPYLRYSGN